MNKSLYGARDFLPPKGVFFVVGYLRSRVVEIMWKKALAGISTTIMVGSHFSQDEEGGM